MDAHLKSIIITWKEYQTKIEQLAEVIDESYDYILGIFQGGYIVAMSLADYLYKSKTGGIISATNMVVYTDGMKVEDTMIKGKKILLVDEVVESGSSIKKCKDILSTLNVAKVSTACIYCNIYSNERIDYFVESFNGDVNYIFPWRNNRDCVSLLADVMNSECGYDVQSLTEMIGNIYGLVISEEVVKHTLNCMEDFFVMKKDRWYIKNDK